MTDSEKLDLLLKEVQELKKSVNAVQGLVPVIKRMDKQIQIISSMLLAPSEAQKVKKAK